MTTGHLAAKVGSRLAHAAMPLVTPSQAMVAATLGSEVVGPSGLGGAGAASLGAGIGAAPAGTRISIVDMVPILTTGVVATGAADVMLGPGQMAVLAPSLPQPCGPHVAQPIVAGSPSVLVHGMQLVRVGDKTSCGATVCDGVKTVVVGGAAAAPKPVSLNDLAGSLGAVVLGAVLTKTGAIERMNELGAALVEGAEKVSAAADKVTGVVSKTLDKAQAKVDKALDKAQGKANATLDKVDTKVNTALDKVTGAIDKTLDKAEAKYAKALDKATGAVTGTIDKATGAVTGTLDKVTGAVDKTLEKTLGAAEKAADKAGAAVDKVAGAAGAALGKVGDLVGSVGGALESILGGALLFGGGK
ncbi:PAAR domain-containing protein [Polyangium sorediatum]|uniref:PAAR domain-containing protein n=1 Tax=Polyangium sorediatum TaxID=889274 RepID=A0ABT6NMK3_9BACT|nr:PAAR domain-containing protein [Polyangium sorediatum]MDI1429546.1 PAAR domain-containing protein [Polyangium sorediatum]